MSERSAVDPASLRGTVAGRPWDPERDERIDVFNPATGELVASVPEAGVTGAAEAVGAATAAFEGWRRTVPKERGAAMLALGSLVEERLEELAELESLDVGKPLGAARKELRSAAEKFRLYAGAGRAMTAVAGGEYLPGVTSFARREPIGVVAALAPWNYPLGVAAWKVAPALMAGNTVVLKPSPQTPLSTMRFGQLAAEVLPPGVLNVISGGAAAGEALAVHPDVGMVSLTGGTATGRRVMELASGTLKRVHFELGGKAPAIVFDDADLGRAVEALSFAAFDNGGQNCVAASRLYVSAGRHEELVAAMGEAASAIEPQDPYEHPDAALGSLVSCAHRERVHGFVERAAQRGAEVLAGGAIGDGPGAYYRPTVLAGCGQGDEIVQREVFGPVVPIVAYGDEREAIEMANGVEFGLAASVWSSNLDRAMRVAAEVRAGSVWVNTHGPSVHEMPFGGFKQSGIGRDLSIHAIEEHTELQHVAIAVEERDGPGR